jgi:uncharacterized protein YggU (UPF0235/DUF167 family)
MKERKHRLHDGKVGAALAVRVTPQAQVNEIAGVQSDGTLQIHLTAPLAEEKLNATLIEFLAAVLDVPAAKIQIVAGSLGADKLVAIEDMDAESLHTKILANLS